MDGIKHQYRKIKKKFRVIGCWYLVVGNIVATYQQSTTKNQKPITDNQFLYIFIY